ncbi:type II toxin-antitoxin system VapC family toxin [Opitutaceae bacterium TAV4]|uniref:PIN domain-containing protein n=1 Tax=Geminisphaera colitermitum TaxID=1148786 RepID=UPI00019652B7|nr:PIN domain-containing protein [Geminisphaera colitermitum]RRJ95420.1 type II toxin-antitoxin system VapC family toxin [Opitutaceae bacterium TAV4]RRJ99935.1 type II toxin-antitoxin system VapC family toxin [Opitutaceae bacterium TAV3]
MLCFLDTNVCIDLLRGRARGRRLPACTQCRLSSIVVAELWTGVHKSSDLEKHRKSLMAFLDLFEVLRFDEEAARHYGEIRAHLEGAGTPIGPLDQLIASQARSQGGALLTANLREFQRVPGLVCLAWE